MSEQTTDTPVDEVVPPDAPVNEATTHAAADEGVDWATKYTYLEAETRMLRRELDEARQMFEAERATWRRRLVEAEVRAAATGRLADPDDALGLVDWSGIEVDPEGKVDRARIFAQLDDLLERKPYLAVGKQGRWLGSADGGPRSEWSTVGRQYTRDEVRNMSALEILQVKGSGQLDKLLGRGQYSRFD